MLNNLAYLFGFSNAETPQEGTDSQPDGSTSPQPEGATSPPSEGATSAQLDGEDAPPTSEVPMATPTDMQSDWVLVDMEELRHQLHKHQADLTTNPDHCACNLSDCGSIDSCLSQNASGLSTPILSSRDSLSPGSCHLYVRTKYGRCREGFLITPPPCFTAKNSDVPVMTELENLLIERPGSMSVYNMLPGMENSRTTRSKKKSSTPDLVPRAKCQAPPKRPHPFDDRSNLVAKVAQVKDVQRAQQKLSTKQYNKKSLARLNKSLFCDRRTSPRNRIANPSGQKNGRLSQRRH